MSLTKRKSNGRLDVSYSKADRAQTNVNLRTPTRNNMIDSRGKDYNRILTSTRRLVETVIGQLTEHFSIEKVRARSLWYLTNRIDRKVLSHTVGVVINKSLGNPPLQFEKLGL